MSLLSLLSSALSLYFFSFSLSPPTLLSLSLSFFYFAHFISFLPFSLLPLLPLKVFFSIKHRSGFWSLSFAPSSSASTYVIRRVNALQTHRVWPGLCSRLIGCDQSRRGAAAAAAAIAAVHAADKRRTTETSYRLIKLDQAEERGQREWGGGSRQQQTEDETAEIHSMSGR